MQLAWALDAAILRAQISAAQKERKDCCSDAGPLSSNLEQAD
jgi:hypothetical protein